MQNLILKYDKLLKGKFELKKLNFLFVFQVNCPGCFLYGIPFVNKLYKEFNEELSFLGLSTAFEDYEFNNLKNTELLLFKNEVVGETKKSLSQIGINTFDQPIEFPIAMDSIADEETFDFEKGAIDICNTNPNYSIWPEFEQIDMKKRVIAYLKKQEVISQTFTLNQFRGTPTMLVFNDNYEILYNNFGHIKYETIKVKIEEIIDTFN